VGLLDDGICVGFLDAGVWVGNAELLAVGDIVIDTEGEVEGVLEIIANDELVFPMTSTLGNEIRRKWGEVVGARVGWTFLDLVM